MLFKHQSDSPKIDAREKRLNKSSVSRKTVDLCEGVEIRKSFLEIVGEAHSIFVP